jgi:ribonucleoside-diphosphate reductase alpha subunit
MRFLQNTSFHQSLSIVVVFAEILLETMFYHEINILLMHTPFLLEKQYVPNLNRIGKIDTMDLPATRYSPEFILTMTYSMHVLKRNGNREAVSFDKVLSRVRKAARGLSVNPDALAQQVLARIYDGVPTTQLDELTAANAASLSTIHQDWGILASRIAVSNHHKNTTASFSEVMRSLANQVMPKTGEKICYISQDILNVLDKHSAEIDAYIIHERDYLLDYFGFKTLEKSYLLKDAHMVILERPQHMWMRVALALWGTNLERVFETYDVMSEKYMTHATPTLFNAGTPRQQLSSCYLLAMADDSIAGIYKTLGDCAAISKHAGGIGLHVHNVRARGSLIRGTNGTSNGLVPMLRVFNNTARYVDQGGGKRNGSFAIYLEPWHADVEDFLKLKLNSGSEEERARDLFYALWVPDLFMERIEADGEWTLFCPSEAPGLADVFGDNFKKLYEQYEKEGRGRKTVSAQKLWFQILDTQMETGTPYLVYKDPSNKKSNQQNLGTIKSSNLCTEILEFSNSQETAVCNLASLALPSFVKDGAFDFKLLMKMTTIATRNLNRVIDINFYPTPETKRSNMRHRPIGLGIQGLADVFAMLKLSWESDEAIKLNQLIFEHMYYAAAETSCNLAEEEGSYETFYTHVNPYASPNHADWGMNPGSPASTGRLQPDLWNITPITESDPSYGLDWKQLRETAKKGMRNSLLMAPMPTASTSQILGFNECFEPFTSNLYTRRTLAGEFIVINKYLMKELMELGVWCEDMKQQIIARNGSVQGVPGIPEEVQQRYKTTWEIKQRVLIDMAAARGAFICQSQSLNLFVADPNYAKLTSMHFHAWKQGLKTGCYYLRTKAPVAAQKFTIDPRLLAAVSGGTIHSQKDDDDDDASSVSSDSSSSSADEETSEERKKRERKELLERLAAEYEASVKELAARKESGEEVCEMCSS